MPLNVPVSLLSVLQRKEWGSCTVAQETYIQSFLCMDCQDRHARLRKLRHSIGVGFNQSLLYVSKVLLH